MAVVTRVRLAIAALVMTACGDPAATTSEVDAATAPPDSTTTDSTTTEGDAASDADADAGEPAVVPADTYCERIAESFCDFYVRCGRMAVADVAACRPVFLETCNARYEPLWVALADRQALALSSAGLAACATHLATVACEQQIFDLDGACKDVWDGQVPAGGACGPGLESFVCADATTCVLGLDFCGTCVPLAGPDEACDLDHRCPPTHTCEDGQCLARRLPGETCDDAVGCVLGASCRAGVCAGDVVVGIGDPCDQDHACPYKSNCVSGELGARCVETVLAGESCGGQTGCASGFCDAGTCVLLGDTGEGCSRPDACASGRCEDDTCAAPPTFCLGP